MAAQVRASITAVGSEFKIIRQVAALSRANRGVSCTFLSLMVAVTIASTAKIPYHNFIFFPNITTVIDNIIIKKGISYLLSDGKSTTIMYYLHSRSVNDRQHSLKLTLKFDAELFLLALISYHTHGGLARLSWHKVILNLGSTCFQKTLHPFIILLT